MRHRFRQTLPSIRLSGLMLLAGMAHALSFAPHPLPAWSLQFIQLSMLAALCIRVWRSTTLRQAAWFGFVFGVANFALGLYWLHTSMHVYGGMSWLLAACAVFAFALFEALFVAGACALSYALIQAVAKLRGTLPTAQSRVHDTLSLLLPPVVWACAWTVFEWLRGTLFTGFPWLNIAYAHVDGYLAGWAAVGGAYGIAWLAAFTSAALAMLYFRYDGNTLRAGLAPFALAVLLGLAGILLAQVRWHTDYGTPIVVRLVQGNIPQSQKFDPLLMQQGMDTYLSLAAIPPLQPSHTPDLIVLPETVIPVPQDRLPADQWRRWLDVSRALNATLMLGIPIHDASQDMNRYTNSVIAFGGDTPIDRLQSGQPDMRYDKHHLVPFGEFIPPGFRWFVQAMQIPLGDFTRGSARQPHFSVAGQIIAPNICYEDVFGEEILHAVRPSPLYGPGATLLINVSNLAWFGDSWALRQHLQISRMRSLETARPMLRATNTGATAVIDAHGTVLKVLDTNTPGIVDAQVQGASGLTPYVRTGNLPILLLSWGLLGLVFIACYLRRRTTNTTSVKE